MDSDAQRRALVEMVIKASAYDRLVSSIKLAPNPGDYKLDEVHKFIYQYESWKLSLIKTASLELESGDCACCKTNNMVKNDKLNRCKQCIDLGMVVGRRGWRQLGIYE